MSSARSTTKKSVKKTPAKKTPAKKTPAPKKTAAKKNGSAKLAAKKSPTPVQPAMTIPASKGAQRLAAKTMASEHPTVEMCRELAAIVEAHALTELVFDTPEATLTFRRGENAPASQAPLSIMAAPSVQAAPAPAPSAAAPAPSTEAPATAPKQESGGHVVTSPFVGTFYRSPSPDADSYVDVGQRVEKGQVLCIVEAMKLMNEIESDVAGTIEEILVPNAEPVEYGQPLFRIRP